MGLAGLVRRHPPPSPPPGGPLGGAPNVGHLYLFRHFNVRSMIRL